MDKAQRRGVGEGQGEEGREAGIKVATGCGFGLARGVRAAGREGGGNKRCAGRRREGRGEEKRRAKYRVR